jgi:hypothetical protein
MSPWVRSVRMMWELAHVLDGLRRLGEPCPIEILYMAGDNRPAAFVFDKFGLYYDELITMATIRNQSPPKKYLAQSYLFRFSRCAVIDG